MKTRLRTYVQVNKFDGSKWIEHTNLFASATTKHKGSKVSSSGIFSETETTLTTYWNPNVDEYNNLVINGKYYHILNVNNLDFENKEMVITCTKVELQDCSIERLVTVKDELGRPRQELQTIATYPGILTKKWIKYIQDTPMSAREEEFVFVFPSACNVEQADIVRVNGNAYVVTSAFKPVPFRLEVEATLRRDI